ncbi:aldolase/citrate lyase family protein [Neobacillus niacini]|uniref:HpcH/HpaI aldolase family protein n=1 Tax=Neobacillus niacini TaxID=86668 RepID=UPI002FFF1C01
MNSFKEKIKNNQFVLGTMLSEISSPNIARMLKVGGFEYLIIDCEHGYFDYSQTAAIIGVANGIHLPVIIRIPEIRRELITKYMDMGASGLLVPMTGTKEDIEIVVKYAKYMPIGQRGVSTQRAHSEYNPPALADYFVEANNKTIIFAQIETCEGVSNIQDILSVEGVDAAIIGPNDMACDCGTPGDFNSPKMQENIDTVIAAAKAAGKPSGIISGNIPFLKECQEKGMTVFSCNSEVGMIISGAKSIVNAFQLVGSDPHSAKV